jgi:DNA-binding XRE family transcriptional regulator
MSYIYIAPLKDKSAFKVGKSKTPTKRIQHLSKFYDFDMDDITVMHCGDDNGAYTIESVMHAVLNGHMKIKEFDGGTEFFDFYHYNNSMQLLYDIAGINELSPEQLIVDLDVAPIGTFIDLSLSSIGNRARARRLEMNITQDELSKLSSVSKATVCRFERGEAVGTDTLIKIMGSLKMECSLGEPIAHGRKRSRKNKILRPPLSN